MLLEIDARPQAGEDVWVPPKAAGQRCKCSQRFSCEECHGYWVAKRWRKARRWLDEVRTVDTFDLFGTFTVADRNHWTETLTALLQGWAALGQVRSREKRKVRSEHPLTALSRGIGAIHLNRAGGGIRPHLHTLLVFTRDSFQAEYQELSLCWQDACSGVEYADFQEARSSDAVLRYAIGKGLPTSQEDRLSLQCVLKGTHMVRRIGQSNALTK